MAEDASLVDVDLDEGEEDDQSYHPRKKAKKKKKRDDDKDCESQSQMSDSVLEDDPSALDMAEEREKKLWLQLIGLVVAFCGFVFIYKLLRRLLAGYKDTGVANDAAGHVQEVVVETATDAVVQAAFATGNPAVM